jgi:hypothetical protein
MVISKNAAEEGQLGFCFPYLFQLSDHQWSLASRRWTWCSATSVESSLGVARTSSCALWYQPGALRPFSRAST